MSTRPETIERGDAEVDRPVGAARVRELWRLFRNEREDPEPFYTWLADELAADLERRHGALAGRTLLDLGCGPGYYTAALRARGATVVPVDNSADELGPDPIAGALLADASALPLPDGSADGVVCSNLLEHTPDAAGVIREIERVLRPGGWAYLSWTNWYSPHGGHEMSPYHLLGPSRGPRLYERLHGPPRKNRYGEGLFPVHIGSTLRLISGRPGLRVSAAEPRYWPRLRFLVRVPGLREVACWNCVIHLERSRAPEVEGWLTGDQAARLAAAAARVPAGGRIVEIGSYRGRSTIVLASGDADVVAIDPHAGNDRGPRQWSGTAAEGEADHEAFQANLRRAGVADRVRHVRRFSQDALDAVDGTVDLLYVDGAHRFRPAALDILRWGARVAPGGALLVHDAFSSVGVTLAICRHLLFGRRFRYAGRSGSLAEYRREDLGPAKRLASAARQLASLPWFARNLVVKAALVARLPGVARALGHRSGPWPY
jgi:SAM-dependent methyltransferase/predicted O-methyltransferase YrrM